MKRKPKNQPGLVKKRKNRKWFELKRKITVGSYYTDCGWIPRVCLRTAPDQLEGRSLIDGSVGNCSPTHCAPDWMSRRMALRWAKTGPWAKGIKQSLKEFYEKYDKGSKNPRKIWWKE